MKKIIVFLSVLSVLGMTGCAEKDSSSSQTENSGYEYHMDSVASDSELLVEDAESSDTASDGMLEDVYIAFGNSGQTYAMHPYDNDTAAELIRNIGTGGKNLPIYNYEGYEGDDVFQYYDIPSRFEIPSSPETVTEEKAGEIYYSAPNRLILFFGDAQIEGEYTKVGYIDDSEQFRNDVKDNPVIEGWGNLIIRVSLNK